jgi:hypothetical protein
MPAMLLIQIAASHAGIGLFAGRDRETPQTAAGRYRAAAQRTVRVERLIA